MPYGTPSLNGELATWKVEVGHATLVQYGSFVCQFTTTGGSEESRDQFIQDFVDMIDASSNFTLVSAKKATPSGQAVTPTS